MQAYPGITQTDAAQQLFAQIMGGYKPGQLGGQAQQESVQPIDAAEAPGADGLTKTVKPGEYIKDSGAVGVLAQAFDAYAQRKRAEEGGSATGKGGIIGGIIDLMKGGGLQ